MAQVRVFLCDDCGRPPDCPQLHDGIWGRIANKNALLCIRCAEQRLRRQITVDDLRVCPANNATILLIRRVLNEK